MRITTIGGGPAGLYFSILSKRRFPDWSVRVLERNRPLDTFGWGVVFSDATLDNLRAADEPTQRASSTRSRIGTTSTSTSKGARSPPAATAFAAYRASVCCKFCKNAPPKSGRTAASRPKSPISPAYREADLLVGADGVNSRVRPTYAGASARIDAALCRFVWLGTTLPLDAFTFIFEKTEHGWFTVHAYRFDENTSTFIVECREETWLAHGLDKAGTARDDRILRGAVRAVPARARADGQHRAPARPRLAELSARQQQHWVHENVVLMGDAAHTAHFSVGSGTKLAMEDAIGLADALTEACRLSPAGT